MSMKKKGKTVEGFPTEYVLLSKHIASYAQGVGATATAEDIQVMSTAHDNLASAHLRRTYSGRHIWKHQTATDAHRKAHKLWGALDHAKPDSMHNLLFEAKESTAAACNKTAELSDSFPQGG